MKLGKCFPCEALSLCMHSSLLICTFLSDLLLAPPFLYMRMAWQYTIPNTNKSLKCYPPPYCLRSVVLTSFICTCAVQFAWVFPGFFAPAISELHDLAPV